MATRPQAFRPADCLAALSAIETDVSRLAGGLSEEQFHAPTKNGGWSVGLCLEHLIVTAEALVPRWEAVLQNPSPAGPAEFSYSLLERAILYSLEPPYRLKRKAPAWATPGARRSIGETFRRFASAHGELARLIGRSGSLSQASVASPFLPGIQCRLGFAFDSVLAHERRHLWQASRIRDSFTEM
jgi:hypothetical protein